MSDDESKRRAKRFVAEYRQLGDTPYAVAEEATAWTGDESDLPYLVTVDIENTGGAPECTRLVIERRPGGAPITSEGLRNVPVARLVEWAAHSSTVILKDPARGVEGGVVPLAEAPWSDGEALRIVDAVDHDRTTGRRRITDEDLRKLAEVCTRADALGTSYIRLAELELGLTHDQARQWKRKAIVAGHYRPPAKTTDQEDSP